MNNKLTDTKELGKKPLNIFCDAKSDKNYVNSCSAKSDKNYVIVVVLAQNAFQESTTNFHSFVVLSLGRILTLD